MQLKSWLKKALAGLISGLLTGCSLYVPMLPAAPQIRDKGQVEIHGTSFLNRRWEAGVTYSPAKYVLVRAAGGIRTNRGDSTFVRSRQYELAAGGYYPLGRRWLVSGLAGFGQARSGYAYWDLGPDNRYADREYRRYEARYHRLFAELAASYTDNGFTLGVAGRLTDVRYDALTFNSQPVGLRRLPRFEPMVFCQLGRPEGAVPWLRGQVAATGSTSLNQRPAISPVFVASQLAEEVPCLTVSIIILPHLLKAGGW
ncbi:hypothetical protein D0N36_00155 [Hymenobacter lapidiphilus]|uniref:hypothetical protein n=1 Tax=Hymenobacter sp. CCM 8763 TaxID=2303334 RepID=UPI000E348F8D|nr:hypothetical protein [Hymenobacter sp. CCM 8763]RFP66941.1 hypothetical protein D0N36_00155 [Hymenobacter sp. CCM 8763]